MSEAVRVEATNGITYVVEQFEGEVWHVEDENGVSLGLMRGSYGLSLEDRLAQHAAYQGISLETLKAFNAGINAQVEAAEALIERLTNIQSMASNAYYS